jgi:outer membrane lipoprotein SlyB
MKEPTMEEVLKLVTFRRDGDGELYVVCVRGNIGGWVLGNVCGSVGGTINGREWQYVETKKEKVIRLIREGNGEEAIKVLEEGE